MAAMSHLEAYNVIKNDQLDILLDMQVRRFELIVGFVSVITFVLVFCLLTLMMMLLPSRCSVTDYL
jgi:hypothetical protein